MRQMSYVEQREAEIKAKHAAEMWWHRLSAMWDEIGAAMSAKRDADYYMGRFNEIRSKYVKRGRKAAA